MKQWTIVLFEPGEEMVDDGTLFGSSVAGVLSERGSEKQAVFSKKVAGDVLAGTAEEVLEQAKAYPNKGVKSGIVLLRSAQHADRLLQKLSELFPEASFVGGAAAHNAVHPPRIIPNGEVAVLLLLEDAQTDCINFHENLGNITIKRDGALVSQIDGQDASVWYEQQAQQYGVKEQVLEYLTVSDEEGKNIHFSKTEEGLKANATLRSDTAQMRLLNKEQLKKSAQRYATKPQSIIFGCAGLNTVLKNQICLEEGSMIGFFFGEVVTLKQPVFANLMMAALRIPCI